MKNSIEKRAYELFLERGGVHGYHIEDWLRAEKEIRAQLKKQPAKPAKPAARPVVKKAKPVKK
jgi:hypothetical protein